MQFKIEKVERNVTEQIQKSICRKFNVKYLWLTTGEGEMFNNTDNSALSAID